MFIKYIILTNLFFICTCGFSQEDSLTENPRIGINVLMGSSVPMGNYMKENIGIPDTYKEYGKKYDIIASYDLSHKWSVLGMYRYQNNPIEPETFTHNTSTLLVSSCPWTINSLFFGAYYFTIPFKESRYLKKTGIQIRAMTGFNHLSSSVATVSDIELSEEVSQQFEADKSLSHSLLLGWGFRRQVGKWLQIGSNMDLTSSFPVFSNHAVLSAANNQLNKNRLRYFSSFNYGFGVEVKI